MSVEAIRGAVELVLLRVGVVERAIRDLTYERDQLREDNTKLKAIVAGYEVERLKEARAGLEAAAAAAEGRSEVST